MAGAVVDAPLGAVRRAGVVEFVAGDDGTPAERAGGLRAACRRGGGRSDRRPAAGWAGAAGAFGAAAVAGEAAAGATTAGAAFAGAAAVAAAGTAAVAALAAAVLAAAAFAAAAFAAAALAAAALVAAVFAAAALAAAVFAAAALAAWAATVLAEADSEAWLVEAVPTAAAAWPAACSAEGARPHPVSESAPMLMAMAMFFLSKRPLRANGCRAEGSHNLGGKEKHEAILGPGRRGRSGRTAALRIRSPAGASGPRTGPSLREQASTLLDRYQGPQNAGKAADGPSRPFPRTDLREHFYDGRRKRRRHPRSN